MKGKGTRRIHKQFSSNSCIYFNSFNKVQSTVTQYYNCSIKQYHVKLIYILLRTTSQRALAIIYYRQLCHIQRWIVAYFDKSCYFQTSRIGNTNFLRNNKISRFLLL